MLPAPRRSSGSTGVRLSITTPSQSPRPLVLSGHLRGPQWRAVQVFDDNCSLNSCLSILCQEALSPCHAVSSILANIQLPPDRSPWTVGPRSVRMSPAGSRPPCRWGAGSGMRAHSTRAAGAAGGPRRARRKRSWFLKTLTFQGHLPLTAPRMVQLLRVARRVGGPGAHRARLRDGMCRQTAGCGGKSEMRSGSGRVWEASPAPPLGLRPTPHGW